MLSWLVRAAIAMVDSVCIHKQVTTLRCGASNECSQRSIEYDWYVQNVRAHLAPLPTHTPQRGRKSGHRNNYTALEGVL